MVAKKRGLGKGLDALLGPVRERAVDGAGTSLREIPVEWIRPGSYQPRQDFDEESLRELAGSIRSQGLVQPIVLRSLGEKQFEIIAGERRWRAAQMAEMEKIPAIIRHVDDESAVAMSLIENIQREDLNPWEEARALQRLIDEFGLTHQQIADLVGKSRTTVTNSLRLLNLAPGVARMLIAGDLESGHAKALLGLDPDRQEAAAREIITRQLNVRQGEELVRKILDPDVRRRDGKTRTTDPDIRRLQDRLSQKIGQPVTIRHTARGKGSLTIHYGSLDELDGVLERITGGEEL